MDIFLDIGQGLSGTILGVLKSALYVFFSVWWVVVPVALFEIAWKLRLDYLRRKYGKSIKWTMLELNIPRDVLKTPKSMEQVFASLAATYSFGMHPVDIYLEGKTEPRISFEIVGFGKGVHFYIRTPSNYRNLVESALYAQYPSAEISEAEDYTKLFPERMPNKKYDLWGTSFQFIKDDYYPIRTYKSFEEPKDEKNVDPIAGITEVMSNLNEGEMIWLQYLISPTGALTGNNWQEDGKNKIAEMVGRKIAKPKKKSPIAGAGDFARNLVIAPVRPPEWAQAKPEEKKETQRLHPGEQDTVKAIANKISKFGFETIIRFIYIDERERFSPANVAAVMGTFQQFNDQTLNSFKPAKDTITKVGGWRAKFFKKYKKRKEYARKRKLYDFYVIRRFRAAKKPVLCTEELATLYHIPSIAVEAPKLQRLESRKGEPPANLPFEE